MARRHGGTSCELHPLALTCAGNGRRLVPAGFGAGPATHTTHHVHLAPPVHGGTLQPSSRIVKTAAAGGDAACWLLRILLENPIVLYCNLCILLVCGGESPYILRSAPLHLPCTLPRPLSQGAAPLPSTHAKSAPLAQH